MILAAQFRALAVIGADLVDAEPAVVQAARNGVDLHAESGNGPRVDDVGRGGFDVNHGIDRQNHLVVGFEQVRNMLGVRLGEVGCVRQQARFDVGNAQFRIVVGPVPLVAGRLDHHVGGRHVVIFAQQRQREEGDDHQDRDRNDGPGNFDGGIVRELGGVGVRTLVVAHDDPYQQQQHEQADDRDHREQDGIVEPFRMDLQRRRRRLPTHRLVGRLPHQIVGKRDSRSHQHGHGTRRDSGQKPLRSAPEQPFDAHWQNPRLDGGAVTPAPTLGNLIGRRARRKAVQASNPLIHSVP